ncbi:MAG: universal stress protein [Saprospiraceae bacterium]
MKNILVLTDFSTCASYAMDMGIALAEFFGATLHLFTCIENSKLDVQTTCPMMDNPATNRAYFENTNVLFDKWKNEAIIRQIKVKTICCPGNLISSVQEYVSIHDIDFVVMGSHGASGWNTFSMGSNTQKIIRAIHIPIFILKKPVKEYAFKNVVFASTFAVEEQKSYFHFLDFIEKFEPEIIHLLGINIGIWKTSIIDRMEKSMDEFAKLCSFAKSKKHIYRDDFVEAGIRHFAENIEADLVVISNHHRHSTQRIFTGSTVEALVQNCDLPILSIDFPKEKISNFMEIK